AGVLREVDGPHSSLAQLPGQPVGAELGDSCFLLCHASGEPASTVSNHRSELSVCGTSIKASSWTPTLKPHKRHGVFYGVDPIKHTVSFVGLFAETPDL